MAMHTAIAGFAAATLMAAAQATIVIPTVTVGNAGNGADDTGYGAVGYSYEITRFEITADQYAAFLNAVAATDTYSLYNTTMSSNTAGCRIVRSGASGSYTYSVLSGYGNRPANYISWGDAARFANWMHNGQPTGPQGLGTTEDGAYFINGTADSALSGVSRASNARWAIPTEDEWYKAAYHKNDGVSSNYWEYATGSDTLPGKNLADPLGNNANYGPNPGTPIDGGIYWTTLGGEFQNSASPYGSFDQSGNIAEWTEAKGSGNFRVARGGSWINNGASMAAASRPTLTAGGNSQNYVGFRLVYIPVPSPSTMAGVLLGLLSTGRRRR